MNGEPSEIQNKPVSPKDRLHHDGSAVIHLNTQKTARYCTESLLQSVQSQSPELFAFLSHLFSQSICDPTSSRSANENVCRDLIGALCGSSSSGAQLACVGSQRVQWEDVFEPIVMEYCPDVDASRGIRQRKHRAVPTLRDSYLPKNHPVSILNIGAEYRMILRLKSSLIDQSQEIQSVTIKAPDGSAIELNVEKLPDPRKHEAVVRFQPNIFQSRMLSKVSPSCGDLTDKYVKLEISAKLGTNGETLSEVKDVIYCSMVPHNRRLLGRRIAKKIEEVWKWMPQWTRTSISSTFTICKEMAAGAASV